MIDFEYALNNYKDEYLDLLNIVLFKRKIITQ
jgi:hypothetical protein